MHIAQQMPLPLTISCSSKSRLVLTFLVLPFWYLLKHNTVYCVMFDAMLLSDLANKFSLSHRAMLPMDHSGRRATGMVGEATRITVTLHPGVL